MALIRPFFDTDLDVDFDRGFDRMLNRFGFPATSTGAMWPTTTSMMGRGRPLAPLLPTMDVVDTGDSVVVHTELPGITKEQVNVEVQGQQLVISVGLCVMTISYS